MLLIRHNVSHGTQNPVTHLLSTSMEWDVVHGVRKLVKNEVTFQYIPIIAVIQAMLHNNVIYEEVQIKCSNDMLTTCFILVILNYSSILYFMQVMCGHHRDDDIVEDFCDSKLAKRHPLFGKDTTALQILLYYDEIEICNPIGASKTKHKIGTVTTATS